jgi:hypothetical protein
MLNKALSLGSTVIFLYLCATFSSGVVAATPSVEITNSQIPTAKSAKSQPTPQPQMPSTLGVAPAAAPTIAGCPLFPANNIWNAKVDWLPVHPKSNAYISALNGSTTGLHPDFGTEWEGGPIGIPYTVTLGSQTPVTITFNLYGDESDPGPYPIPPDAPIEGGPLSDGDRHVLVVDKDNCKLYEMFNSFPQPDGSWEADSGAVYNLNSNALRTAGWTSADAAGFPILPGLVRYDEVQAGAIMHAVRFTGNNISGNYIWPARHLHPADPNSNLPPYGQRFRLKSSFDISPYPAQVRVILTALKTYGMFLADKGSDWYITGTHDDNWDDEMLSAISSVKGSDFEAVDESFLMLNSNSGQAFIFTPTDFLFMPLLRR